MVSNQQKLDAYERWQTIKKVLIALGIIAVLAVIFQFVVKKMPVSVNIVEAEIIQSEAPAEVGKQGRILVKVDGTEHWLLLPSAEQVRDQGNVYVQQKINSVGGKSYEFNGYE